MTAKRLAIGAAVRHAYDGVRGRVVEVDRESAAYRVRFEDDTEDLVPFADVRVARPRGEQSVAKRRRPAHARRRVRR